MKEFDETTTEIAVIGLILTGSLVALIGCLCFLVRCCRRRKRDGEGEENFQPPILPALSKSDLPSCTNDAFECVDETSARKIEERRRARQQALQQNSPRADLTLRKIDPEIGKALAVEQLMRDSLVFDTLPRPPKVNVEVVAAKRDYL